MTTIRALTPLMALLAAAALAACAPRAGHSGFLRDYSALKPAPELGDALVYQHPTRSLKHYGKFIVEPPVVHFAPNADGTGIDPGEVKALADYWHAQTVQALSARYAVVAEPGPGVLRLRAAITGIKKTVPVANIHPAMKASGIGLGGAALEAEALDAQTGERILAVVDSRTGSRLAVVSGFQTYGHAREVLSFWTAEFVKQVDAAHGVPAK